MEDLNKIIAVAAAITDERVKDGLDIKVSINGQVRVLETAWLVDGGRAAGSPLAKAVLEAKQESPVELTIPDQLLKGWDWLSTWLLQGDLHFEGYLLEDMEKATAAEGLADYFGLQKFLEDIQKEKKRVETKRDEFDVNKNIDRLRGSGQRTLVTSEDNSGVVAQFAPALVRMGDRRGDFGFLLDKDTRNRIWFHRTAVHFADSDKESNDDIEFVMGEEVLFDIQISLSGKKPAVPRAVNVRPLDDPLGEWIHFKWIKLNIMI